MGITTTAMESKILFLNNFSQTNVKKRLCDQTIIMYFFYRQATLLTGHFYPKNCVIFDRTKFATKQRT